MSGPFLQKIYIQKSHCLVFSAKHLGRCVSFHVRALDEGLKFGHWHSLLVAVLVLGHGLLDDRSDFLGRLRQYLIHVLCHWMEVAEVLQGRLGRLGIGI